MRSVGCKTLRDWMMRITLGACAVTALMGAADAHAAAIESVQGFGFTKSARLEAQINPQGADTTCRAQYVSVRAFEREGGWATAATVPCLPEDLGSGSVVQTARVDIPNGLSLDTVYDFRFLATSGANTIESAMETFTTFGLESFSLTTTDSEGNPYTQAGGHPYELTTNVSINASYTSKGQAAPDAYLKDVRVGLPPGLIGDPAATPRCTQMSEEHVKCPGDTQVGLVSIELVGNAKRGEPGTLTIGSPLFNLVPPKGEVARFGAWINGGVSAYIDASVRTGTDYGVNADSLNVTSFSSVKRVVVTMWGVPANPSHDAERSCPEVGSERYAEGCSSDVAPKAFLREPTSCGGLTAVGAIDSYQEPDELISADWPMPAVTNCEAVKFRPSVEAQPSTDAADSPTGMSIDLHFPQNEDPSGVSTGDLRNATVVLPAGVTVDPSLADGLSACSEAQVGFEGFKELDSVSEPGVQTAQFTPGPAECPNASKLASAQVDTPLIEHPLPGALYLAAPHTNPFGSLLAVYLSIHDPVTGVVIKLPGRIQADAATGQLTTVFEQNPQLPFEDLKIKLFSGARAPLSTPTTCGSYAMGASMTAWSGGSAATLSSNPFQVTEAPGGGACAGSEGAMPNGPGFAAGTASPVAGSYSPFVLKLGREDGSQRFSALDVTLPAGLVGRIAGLEECPQAAIEAAQHRDHEGDGELERRSPSCPAGSEVGVVHVGAGSGSPLYVAGRAYFAGPYEGAPFSLVIVTPAVAGPFDLGTVVVRAGLYIDPLTAQVSVRSDPFPTILDGIPLDIRSIGVDIDRAGFVLNPTSCATMAVTGQEHSTTGQRAVLSDRFQAGGCTEMPFHPSFTVSTLAHGTRKDGTGIAFKVSYPAGALGREAWLASARFEFPKQLPARQKTLEQACTSTVFESDPASCPSGSRIGTASVRTQLLSVPLAGPVYLVSYGSAKFPEAVFVLQGDGITIDLHSETFIDEKTGITSATLRTVPGVPFEEATVSLPAGPYSEFALKGNICTRSVLVKRKITVRVKGHERRRTRTVRKRVPATALVMPTVLIGQNGAVIHQKTPITVTGCTSTVKHKTKPKPKHRHAKKHNKPARKKG